MCVSHWSILHSIGKLRGICQDKQKSWYSNRNTQWKILFGCHNKFKYFDYIFLSFQNLKKGKIQKKNCNLQKQKINIEFSFLFHAIMMKKWNNADGSSFELEWKGVYSSKCFVMIFTNLIIIPSQFIFLVNSSVI